MNALVILQSLRLMIMQLIFGSLTVILSFHFAKLMIREGNLIYLGCKSTHGLHIQRLRMELLCSLFVFQKKS